MLEERRHHSRLTPKAPLFVSLDESAPGLLLDVCEGGVALASLAPRNLDEEVSLAFDLPQGRGHIKAKAEIAWTRDEGHLSGVRFVDLADVSRQQLEQWISGRASAASATATAVAEPVEPAAVTAAAEVPVSTDENEAKDETVVRLRSSLISLQLNGEATAPEPAPWGSAVLTSAAKSRYPFRIFLAIMLLSWALVFLGYRMGTTGVNPQAKEVRSAAKTAESVSKGSMTPVEASTSATSSVPHSLAWSDPGVVLQVAAMKEETNADTLAETLQRKNFPAFVFRRGGDRLYKVAVGPYSDAEADAAAKVKDDLEKQGLKPLSKRWLPE
jgi:septal ring-binding cell division protein DamX